MWRINGKLRLDVLGSDGVASVQATEHVFVQDKMRSHALPRVTTVGDKIDLGLSLTTTEK